MQATQPCSLCGQATTRRSTSCCQVYYCTDQHQYEDWPRHRRECRVCEMQATPPCSLCGKATTRRCSSCCQVYYCTDQHQNEDWPRHRRECRACEVFPSSELGYCLKATRDITEGDVIMKETPFIIGPSCFSGLPCCVGCSSDLPEDIPVLPRCPECQWLVCSTHCPKLLDPAGHKVECAMLKLVEDKVWSLILPFRCMFLQKSNPRLWNWLLNHSSKAVARLADESLYHHAAVRLETIANTIFQKDPSVLPLDYSAATFTQIYKVLDAFGLDSRTWSSKRDLTGLYKIAGFLKLSCDANTRTDFYVFPETVSQQRLGRVVITAIKDIKKGQVLSSSYAMSLASTYFRQAEYARRNLVCRCPRCLDPREMGLDSGTMKCAFCTGWLLPVDTANILTCDWACDRNCGVTRTAEEVVKRYICFFELYESVVRPGSIAIFNPETIEGLLAQFLSELHPNHILCFLIRRMLLKSYGSSQMHVCPLRLSDEHLKRRADLCREMLNGIDRFGPNIYRGETLVVCTLMEYAETQFQLTQKNYMHSNWTTERALSNIVHCLKITRRAFKILDTSRFDLDRTSNEPIRETHGHIFLWASQRGFKIPHNINTPPFSEPL